MRLTRLILFRHGKAESRAATGEDFDRALTERGRNDSRRMGERLAAAGLAPDVALVSSAVRTLETWEQAAPAFPKAKLDPRKELYNAAPDVLLEAARDSGAASVALIAHNPGLEVLAAELMGMADGDAGLATAARKGFPPASAAVFRIDGPRVICEAYYSPKDEGA